MEVPKQRKPRVLCLHGFRTNAKILHKLTRRLPETVLEKLDLVFLDAPFPARGKSPIEGIYDPPYYEWFQINEDFTDYTNFEECVAYIEDYMVKNGPFDGFLGFSQGSFLSATFPGMQSQGAALRKVEKIKFLIVISGGQFGAGQFGLPKLASNAFSKPIDIPTLHIIGEKDHLKEEGLKLLDSCVDPFVIRHPIGHTIPRLDDDGLKTALSFIEKIQSTLSDVPHNTTSPENF